MTFLHIFVHACLLPLALSQNKPLTASVYEQVKIQDSIHGVQRNLDVYSQVAANAAANGADIIVFPEIGVFPSTSNRTLLRQFTESIPDPKTIIWNPCTHQSVDYPILVKLSCIARSNKIYLVANIADEQQCKQNETCRPDGVNIFNTNVAFDKSGTLVARYHKRFLFFESAYDRPDEPNYIYFDTEFGRFGLVTCFDIMFQESVKLVENFQVETIIAPSWWFDELPFLSAIQMFSGWAVTNRVNLLLANEHRPQTGSLGSGIFTWSHGALNFTHNTDDNPVLLIANLSSSSGIEEIKVQNSSGSKFRYTITDMSNYTAVSLKQPVDDVMVCNNGLCCRLQYNSSASVDNYYLAAHSGLRFVKNYYSWYEEVCTVFKCETNSSVVCKQIPLETTTTFHNFHLKGNFSVKYVYPSVVGPDLMLIPHRNWDFSISSQSARLKFKSGPPLLLANLFGRVYSKDPEYHP